ncbi:hypothetical protein EYF80_067464 [Liparis tanakae]|uniref:Uncharacterized protein n=1 Tax=Liparis tanakae TaxID=230148 RepID=A0A4Z2E0X7_9TELE|nr:hypothetical protein EYF80_067464 [Liparis tanakae]
MSVSLDRSSSLAACRAEISASGFSLFARPFLAIESKNRAVGERGGRGGRGGEEGEGEREERRGGDTVRPVEAAAVTSSRGAVKG